MPRRGGNDRPRSEERRVGEECRFRWSPDYLKKKNTKEFTLHPREAGMRRPSQKPRVLSTRGVTSRETKYGPCVPVRVGEQCVFFFFQAEDGIRDYKVTGVQTCALPISCHLLPAAFRLELQQCSSPQ